ncbi:anchored repeat ABC transporter, substrate-binding protein [Bifidobacterium tibiigranuli]|uniref:anchored repeat ABC transporter, substrate-binding protein n=1 Tax=Bifidobacterium tibiigranuli TaxID=2172043 RepID=UPI0026F04FF8|nr:anchored repeat ABC transporter, substrate-binding protein [Bifidobacterium tibiigranuli]MCI1713331.1 anchored repeat ABC transporter, substrate-binding protein [Bifidobacterium tibiigranuli]MCI1834568.1 anchored repeat ABC transporter, substrate-binding protein [Bifidobacterium tibiigranuli]
MSAAARLRGQRGRTRGRGRLAALVAMVVTAAFSLGGCTAKPLLTPGDGKLQVVTTTGILRDLVKNVGGDRVDAVSIIPDGADPHTYEPTLRDARNVVYADVAFSNYAMLEEHNIIKVLDTNLPKSATNVSLVEESAKYAADLIQLTENVNLNTVWLGLRVWGSGQQLGVTRDSDVLIQATNVTGPGKMYGYLTGTFGDTSVYFDSSNGFDASDDYKDDTATLPADSHTHLSWAFTKPGIYHVTLRGQVKATPSAIPVTVGQATYTFAVGVNPSEAGIKNPVVFNQGHADLSVELDNGGMDTHYDPTGGGEMTQKTYPANQVVIEVPNNAIAEIPGDRQFRFLGHPGDQIYQLAQAVLGNHVHGELDPHTWQNVRNAEAYVKLIRDTLSAKDPAGTATYSANAARYLSQLDALDNYMRTTIAKIPQANRYLVTTHDGFAYLGKAYGIQIAGFVTPNPSSQPSLADRRKLTESIHNLKVKAVFLEPNLKARSSDLTQVANEQHVKVCPIYGDTLDSGAPTYIDMMRFNANTLRKCLG